MSLWNVFKMNMNLNATPLTSAMSYSYTSRGTGHRGMGHIVMGVCVKIKW